MPEEIDETEWEYEDTTREGIIASCYNAIAAVDGVDFMFKVDTDKASKIKRRCLKILDKLTAEMYDEIFEDRDEEE